MGSWLFGYMRRRIIYESVGKVDESSFAWRGRINMAAYICNKCLWFSAGGS
jgi:hypothetical protein